jgi:hypothetical protein
LEVPVARPRSDIVPIEEEPKHFLNYTRKPMVHRVGNSGRRPFRVVDVEIHQGCGGYVAVRDAAGQGLVLENDRVRVTRILLEPGASVALHPPCGVLVAVSGGAVALVRPGAPARIAFEPAGFDWRESFAPIELTNVGAAAFHAVDVVLK